MKKKNYLGLLALLTGCAGLPDNVTPIRDFDPEAYLGTWYEVARLDHSFERGLSQVTANYSKRDDGGIKVVNRGFNKAKGKWDEATGKAYLVGDSNVGHLKVSFFGPFYASYVIFHLSDDKQTAYVAGYNHDYLWMLSRTPTVSPAQKDQFKRMAGERGFNVSGLIWVEQVSASP